MTCNPFKPCFLAVLGTALTLPSLFGNIIAPNSTVTPDQFTSTAYIVLASTGPININPLSGTSFNATYTETVARVTTAAGGLCVGCLNFFITVQNAGPGIAERVSTADFDSFMLDVGYNTTTSIAGSIAPTSVDRSVSGGVVGFDFIASGLLAGETTSTLEIQTNATNYTSGTVSIQDGTSGFGAGFAPVAAPEPAFTGLIGGGMLALGLARRKKVSQS